MVECNFCRRNPSDQKRFEEKHCPHCHKTYKEWMPHIRNCEKFLAHWLQQTGYPLNVKPRKRKIK